MKKNVKFISSMTCKRLKYFSIFTSLVVVFTLFTTTFVFAGNIPNITQNSSLQGKKITGQVKDSQGIGIPGVNIIIKGTTIGTASDVDGNFFIEVEENSVLVFSSIGYLTEEIVILKQQQLNVVLIEDIENLSEVVIVGYGVQKKSDLTGAVSSVKAEDISKIAVSTPAEALQGRISGVTVSAKSGAPGSAMNVKIRGIGSFGGNSPLYVIDGVPGDINFVNPEDINSFEVLKDASSAAIYGSRAANGVILITTKSGKKGDVKVNYTSYYGVQNVVNTLDLCNTEQWLKVNKMAMENAGKDLSVDAPWHTDSWGFKNANTDWQDEVFRQSAMQNHNLNISGGTEDLKYMVSGGLFKQDGTVIGTGMSKYNLRAKAELKKKNLTVSPNFAIQSNSIDLQTLSLSETRKIVPLIPVYDKSTVSGYGYIPDVLPYDNPVGKQNFISEKEKNYEAVSSVNVDYEIIEGVNASVNSSITNNFYNKRMHRPSYKINSQGASKFPAISERNFRRTTYLVEPLLQVKKDINKSNVKVMLGGTILKKKFRSAKVFVEGKDADGNRAGFLDENFNTIDGAIGGIFSGDGTEINYTRQSVFSRFNYSYDGKYIFQATVRRDGSSRFGEDQRYGTFPSVSAGWNIHKEKFFSSLTDIVNSLKIRASYGKIGSETNIYDYEYAANIYSGYGYPIGNSQNLSGSNGLNVLDNRNLKWEEVTAQNFGVDFELLDSKISGCVNYYINNREDMLLNTPIPWSAGISNPKLNIGEMENKGFELELSYRDKVGEFNWEVNGTFTTINNNVEKLAKENQVVWGDLIGFEEAATKTIAGESIASFYLYKTDGIFQSQEEVNNYKTTVDGVETLIQPDAKPGDIRFKDINGDGEINGDDKEYCGSSVPDFEYSFNINFDYKNFDFTAFFNGVSGNKIFNVNRFYTENMKDNNNYSTSTIDAWTTENTNTSMPRAVFGDPNANSRVSDRFLEDGDFLRLKMLQIGYTLPKNLSNKINIDKLRVYVSGQNLLTITNYKGYDPEIGENKEWNMGIDWGGYPISKSLLFGVQLTF
ncbi:MAG: TonB-dependent receptor [Bacteroidetes bacterium]|nr:TonB-dependent receptor [Bacteroidota bacterium]